MTDVNLDNLLPESYPTDAGVVSWSPPMPNWNPWTGCNIDEGPLSNANMDQISEDLAFLADSGPPGHRGHRGYAEVTLPFLFHSPTIWVSTISPGPQQSRFGILS